MVEEVSHSDQHPRQCDLVFALDVIHNFLVHHSGTNSDEFFNVDDERIARLKLFIYVRQSVDTVFVRCDRQESFCQGQETIFYLKAVTVVQ